MPCKVEFFQGGCLAFVYRCFTDSDADREDVNAKKIQMDSKGNPEAKLSQKGAKWSDGISKTQPAEQDRKSEEQGKLKYYE